MNTEGIWDIFFNTYKLDWLLGQLFHYFYLFISICVIQNVFLIIIGDGYVKSKYFHQNNWIKAGDEGIPEDDNGEDPLEPFEEKNPQAEQSTKALVRMLRADKEILLTEYYKSKGQSYCPLIHEGIKLKRAPEQLTRAFNTELDKSINEFNDKVNEIQNESSFVENARENARENKIDDIYDKAQVILQTWEDKLNEIEKELD